MGVAAAVAAALAVGAAVGGGATGEVTPPPSVLASRRGLTWLAAEQLPDGSWGTPSGEQVRFKPGCTGLAVLAFAACRYKPGDAVPHGKPLAKAVDYLLGSADVAGCLKGEEPANMYNHGFAMLALAQVAKKGYKERDIRLALARAVNLTRHAQHDDGGWRYTPVPEGLSDVTNTATQVAALAAAAEAGVRVPADVMRRALDYTRKLQQPDGGFAYMAVAGKSGFPRSAAALFAVLRARADEPAVVKKGIGYLKGVPDEQRRAWLFYAQYYATRAMALAGKKPFQAWMPDARGAILKAQRPDGSWGDKEPRVYSTALAILALTAPAPR